MNPIPIAVVSIASSPESADVFALAAEVGLPEPEVARLVDGGLERIPVSSKGVAELVFEAVDEAQVLGWDPASCTTAIFTHSLDLSRGQLERIARGLTDRCSGLRRAPVLVTGHPCSVLHLGIGLGAEALDPEIGTTVIVLGSDVAPNHEDRFFFGSVMGDAGVALVLGGEPRFGSVLSTTSSTHVVASDGTLSPPEDIARFRLENPSAIRNVISTALSASGLGWHDLTAIVPHTPYRQIWDVVAKLCSFPRELIFDDYVRRTGHLNSNDVLVHYCAALAEGRISNADVVALVSPGFGGTRGCTVVRR